MNNSEVHEIKKVAKAERGRLDLGYGPIGMRIFSILRNENIQMLYYKSIDSAEECSLSAFYLRKYSSVLDNYSCYIAINTSLPLDLQIFNVGHEYYHHIDKADLDIHVQRLKDPDDRKTNNKANRFAAEFLLPKESIHEYIKDRNKGDISINDWDSIKLFRLIAQIHIEFQVPYKTIVRRLYEIDSICDSKLKQLLDVNERDRESIYYKIGMAINGDIFHMLNKPTEKSGSESDSINMILSNFENELITLDTTIKDLQLFDKSLQDYGYEIEVDDDDLEDIFELFGGKDIE